jgi:hypothetical protein
MTRRDRALRPADVRQPILVIMEGVMRWARRYFLFENWTWDEPEVAAQRRSSWPSWRRAIRPVGAVAWWSAAVVGLVLGSDRMPLWIFVLGSVLVSVALACVLFGIADGIRQRRQTGRPHAHSV